MIWIVLDEESGDYELVEFQTDSGARCVVSPPVLDDVDWSAVGPDWVREHGTVVVLIGSEEYPDTVLGNPHAGEKDIKGLRCTSIAGSGTSGARRKRSGPRGLGTT
jgi:hypothetical protein